MVNYFSLRLFIQRFLLIAGVFFVLPSFASAQFTLLPQPAADADCKQLLRDFELTGVIPTVAENKNNIALQSKSDYEAAKKAYEDSNVEDYKPICDADPSQPLCQEMVQNEKDMNEKQQKMEAAQKEALDASYGKDVSERDNLLGCAVKTGRISLAMIPYFVTYISNFILAMIGLIVVLMIVVGGYQYVYGGLADQKEKGKNTITHALGGMAVALLAWVIVNVVIAAVTG